MSSGQPSRLRTLALGWLEVGTQSFGGGISTIFMIRRVFADRLGWITAREVTDTWAMSLLSPGVHFVATAAMLGQRMAGMPGLVISVIGLILPASLITIAITAFYALIAKAPIVVDALAGVAPITAALALGFALSNGKAALPGGRRGLIGVALVALMFVAAFASVSTVLIVLVSALVGGFLLHDERTVAIAAPIEPLDP